MNDLLINSLGWVGFLLILFGYYFNAKKKIYCFFIWGVGNTIYFIYGYIIDALPVMAMSIFILGMNIYGYFSWTNKK
tara:strand:- start:684 stop:914 length:231 start_codon:yes stop_codon:yes gene_type:complete